MSEVGSSNCDRGGASNSSSLSSSAAAARKKKQALYSFVEARRIARGHGFSSVKEFMDYDCPGAYQVPKNPQDIWRDEFNGWDDFLGLPLKSLKEAKDVLRQSPTFQRLREEDGTEIKTKEQYFQLFLDKLLNEDLIEVRLPYRPDLKFKDDWISWDDYLLHSPVN